MIILTTIFITIIATLSSVVIISIIINKRNRKDTIFVNGLIISTCFLIIFKFTQQIEYLTFYFLIYILLTNLFFKELKIHTKFYIRNLFFLIPVFVLIEIISYFLLPEKYQFLFFIIFLVLFLIVELFYRLEHAIENVTKTTVNILLISFGIILNFNLFVNYEKLYSNIFIYLICYNTLFACYEAFFHLIELKNINSPQLNYENNTKLKPEDQTSIPLVKYEKSSIDEELAEKILNTIQNLDTKFYLNPILKQDDMAKEINISRHHLSQVLNSKLNCNFHQFINSKRLEYAKDLLINTEADIETLAMQSGFNSKVTFYRAFKNIFGISPGDYRKKNKHIK